MNAELQELYLKAVGKPWSYDFDPDTAERFAELIIECCCDQVRNLDAQHLKQHFGVK